MSQCNLRGSVLQGVSSPLAGQMVFRMTLFSAFGGSKRWLSTNADGSTRPLVTSDFYKVLEQLILVHLPSECSLLRCRDPAILAAQ